MTKAKFPCFYHSNQNVWLHYCSRCFWQSCKWASFWSPNPARARHLFLKVELVPKVKFTERVNICATGYQKCSVRVYLQVHGFITPKIATTLTKTLA